MFLQLMYFTAFSFLYYFFHLAITKNTFTGLHHEYIRCPIRDRNCLPLAWIWVHPGCFVGFVLFICSVFCVVFFILFVFVLCHMSYFARVVGLAILECPSVFSDIYFYSSTNIIYLLNSSIVRITRIQYVYC